MDSFWRSTKGTCKFKLFMTERFLYDWNQGWNRASGDLSRSKYNREKEMVGLLEGVTRWRGV